MRKPLRALAAASLIAALPIAAPAVAQVTQAPPPATPTTAPGIASTPNAIINPIGARLVLDPVPVVDGISANGERIPVATASNSAPAVAAIAAPRETPAKQRKVGRNEQRLYTIAPRTTVDRSAEMPDDPVSPAVTPPRVQY